MEKTTIGAVAALLLSVSAAALAAKNKKNNGPER